MAKGKHVSEETAGCGCLLLIVLAIVLTVIAFVRGSWEFFFVSAAGLAVLLAGLLSLSPRPGANQEATAGRAQQEGTTLREKARRAGENDMRTAWFAFQLGSPAAPQEDRSTAFLAEKLAVVPRETWSVAQLRTHGRSLWALRKLAGKTSMREQLDARLDRVAAMISDLSDEEFDARCGQTSDQYLYHPDREVRAAYLEGGDAAVEAIMDTITAARSQAREDAATSSAAEAAAQQRNAALRALRETQQRTEARDAHAAWEERARKVDE